MLSLHQTKFIVNPLEKTQINLMVGKAPQQKQHFKWDRFQLRGRKISELKKKKKGKLEKGVLRLAWSPRDVYHGGVKHYFNLLFKIFILFIGDRGRSRLHAGLDPASPGSRPGLKAALNR